MKARAGYVDGFLIPVPRRRLGSYLAMARLGDKVWRDHGALRVVECVGDDLAVKAAASFGRTLRLKRGETAVFSWIEFKSRAHRDRVNAKVMKDPRMQKAPDPMPFEMKRMVYGGFRVRVGR